MKLEIKKLTKKAGAFPILKDLDLSIAGCRTLVLIGPSGSGKSTLLKIIAGLQIPDRGELIFDDHPLIFNEKSLIAHRKSIGIVFQSWNLFPHLSALDNIVLPLQRVHGFSRGAAIELSMGLLKRFELEKHAYKKPFALSGGQTQRVALLRAIAGNPNLILLDEPTSALDPLMTFEVLELIMEMKKEGKNLIFITHHMHFARKIADEVVFLAGGHVIEQGHVEAIFENPQSDIVQEYMQKVLAY